MQAQARAQAQVPGATRHLCVRDKKDTPLVNIHLAVTSARFLSHIRTDTPHLAVTTYGDEVLGKPEVECGQNLHIGFKGLGCRVGGLGFMFEGLGLWREPTASVVSKETQYIVKRDLVWYQKRPSVVSKETRT